MEDKWNAFLESLCINECDEEKVYFEAIKMVSDIKIDEIDNSDTRIMINDSINKIISFIDNHKDFYELGKVKGFKANDDKSIAGRDYYYYIADQQIKATVYYARYLNFIINCSISSEREKTIKERLLEICGILGIQMSECENISKIENLIEKIDKNDIQIQKIITNRLIAKTNSENSQAQNGTTLFSELKNIRIELLQYLEELNISVSEDVHYKIYMMLNNMMHEIRFFGAAYQYLWHWKQYKKTLYRSGSLKLKSDEGKCKSVYKYMKKMFKDCIDHMNYPSNMRHSFSENLLLDVYKYLIFPKAGVKSTVEICDENCIKITSDSIENGADPIEFFIIKDADINSVFENGQGQSFYEFIQHQYDNDMSQDYAYTVEIYPQDLNGEKNEKGTVKEMRDTLLPAYFASWGIDVSFSRTKVADDKEVITYGKCYKVEKKIETDNNIEFVNEEPGTLFSLKLDKKDIICLLLKIYNKKIKDDEKVVDNIVEKIVSEMKFDQRKKGKLKALFDGDNKNWDQILIWNKIAGNPFELVINVEEGYLNIIKNENVTTFQDSSKKIVNDIKEGISKYLLTRYQNILKNKNSKVEFIMSTIGKNDFNFWLVSQYNEYMANQEDAEIAMLKYIIFKEA